MLEYCYQGGHLQATKTGSRHPQWSRWFRCFNIGGCIGNVTRMIEGDGGVVERV